MVWATLRRAPRRAYLEFEAQPAPSVVYTLRLDTQRKAIPPTAKRRGGCERG